MSVLEYPALVVSCRYEAGVSGIWWELYGVSITLLKNYV